MGKKLIAAIAVLFIASSGMALAAVENVKVSGDITAGAVLRNLAIGSTRNDAGTSTSSADYERTRDSEDFLFSQVRLRFDADLTEGVSAVVQLINERLWGDEDNTVGASSTSPGTAGEDTNVDVDLGYIELREFLYQPLTVVVGRQYLRYGNALIVGDPDTNRVASPTEVPASMGDMSLRKSFDAVRMILDYSPYTLDLVYAKVDEGSVNRDDDITLVGANLAYEWSSYNGVSELYIFSALGRTGAQVPEDEDNTITIGGRAQYDPDDNWTLGLEGAYQFGNEATSTANTLTRQAWAYQAMGEYRFLDDNNSKVGLAYTYLSGNDGDESDGDFEGWDSMFEDYSPAEILNILRDNTNAHYITLTGSMMPREDVTVGLLYTHARLDAGYQEFPILYGSTGNDTPRSVLNTGSPVWGNSYTVSQDEKHFGDEIDAYAIYDYTEDVQLKLTGAVFMPGNVFVDDGTAYSVKGGVTVDF